MRQDSGMNKPDTGRGVLPNMTKTLAALAAAFLLCLVLRGLGVGGEGAGVVLVLAVCFVSAVTPGYAYGLAAVGAGALLYVFFAPRQGSGFGGNFPVALGLMLLAALLTSAVTAGIKGQIKAAQNKERRAELLCEMNQKLLSSRDEGTIARCAMEYLKTGLGRSVALFTAFDDENGPRFYFCKGKNDADADFFAAEAERAAARSAAEQRQGVGAPGPAPAGARGCYYPLATQGELYGVVGLSGRGGELSREEMPFFDLLLRQTAQALRVQALTRRQQEIMVLAETEKARSSFLRGMSHDLRTPLTSIIGASGTLFDNSATLDAPTCRQLAEGIQTDAQWLLSMVENILSVTRMQENGMAIAKTEEAAEEVVGEAVSVFRRRCPRASIRVSPPRELLLVPMDALLITQVLNNLLDNTQRHAEGAGTQVVVEICENGGYAEFSVADNGPGLSEQALHGLFENCRARPGPGEDSPRGMGIGLSICKTIVEAHGGWVQARNQPQGGARFTFGLPLDEEPQYGK